MRRWFQRRIFMAAVGSVYSGRFSAACRTGCRAGVSGRQPDVPICCRAGRYTGIGWSPGGVCGKDCRTGRRTCRYVAGQVVIGASDGRRNGLSEERSALVGRTAREAVWTIAGRVPGMAAGGYSRLFRVSGCCRTTTGATGPPFSCRALFGPVTRLFLRPPATGFLLRPVCGSDRGKSSRV